MTEKAKCTKKCGRVPMIMAKSFGVLVVVLTATIFGLKYTHDQARERRWRAERNMAIEGILHAKHRFDPR